LLQLNFAKKDNKTISPYYQRQVDFLSKPPSNLNEKMSSQASLVMNRAHAPPPVGLDNTLSAAIGTMPSNRDSSLNWLLGSKGQQSQSFSHHPSNAILAGAGPTHQSKPHIPEKPEKTNIEIKQL
jgi:hypothetical protein